MRTIIIDDEKPAISILSTFIKKIPFLKLQLATTNAFEAIELLNNKQCDLLFLDIEMPDITGIDFLESIEYKPLVIFTTAYEQYALKGYELDVVDYLVKPIRFERFFKAANKACQRFKSNSPTVPFNNFLLVKSEYKTVRIELEEILYIEGLKDYVKIYTQKEMILTRLNLKGIQAKLPREQFIRIHRSFIASLSKVSAFQKQHITIGNKVLPIGEAYRQALLDRLD